MKPNQCVVLFSIILASVASEDIRKATRLRAVTDFSAIEEYYYNLHTERTSAHALLKPSNSVERAAVKRALCKKIFTTPYFQVHQQEWIDVEETGIRNALKRNYRPIFDTIFKIHRGRYEYENPYRLYSFRYDDERAGDYMFVCLVRKIRSRKIKAYFVTRVYDVNSIAGGSPIAGRFIFTFDRDDLVVRALAEESASESTANYRTIIAEYWYLGYRRRSGPSEFTTFQLILRILRLTHILRVFGTVGAAEMDPICWLTPSEKLRLCTSVFASKVLRRKYKFSPTVEHVEFECKRRRVALVAKKRVRLLSAIKRSYFDRNRTYEEWTIGCTAERIGSPVAVTYYVSRGESRNTAFAYKKKFFGNRIYVVHYFKNVSVVGDGTSEKDFASEYGALVGNSSTKESLFSE